MKFTITETNKQPNQFFSWENDNKIEKSNKEKRYVKM